jgi:hypothetical protein
VGPTSALRLLFACGRSIPDGQEVADLARSLGPAEWAAFLSLSRAHALVPLVRRALGRAGVAVPDGVAEVLSRVHVEIGARQAILARELTRVVGELQRADIPVLVYKGPALAVQAYGDAHARSSQDLDLLVRPVDFLRARSALLASGYSANGGPEAPHPVMFRSECDESLVHVSTSVMVELHWAVTPPYLGTPYDVPALFDRSVPIEAGTLSIRAPGLEDTVVLQSINGTKDAWGKLETAIALAAIIRRDDLDWSAILRFAAEVRALRTLHIALELVRLLLTVPVPAAATDSLARDDLARAIARETRDRIQANPLAAMGARQRLMFAVWARDSGPERLRLLLRRAFTPTEADVRSFPLPGSLWPLHYLLRPIRLLRQGLSDLLSP